MRKSHLSIALMTVELFLFTALYGKSIRNMDVFYYSRNDKKFEKKFKEAGIQNINDPKYGVWMDSHHHLSKAKEYNAKWEKYLSKKPSKSEIEEYAKTVMEEVYGK